MAAPDTACKPTYADCYPAAERIRYFLGRHLTERDFTDADRYPLSHLRAHNWMLHGWGVVAGLRVEPFPDNGAEECRKKHVIVKKGAALDPWGRLIVLPHDVPVQLPGLPDGKTTTDEAHTADKCCSGQTSDLNTPPPAKSFLLCIRYHECEIEQVPVVVSHPADGKTAKAGRVREGYSWCKLDYNPNDPKDLSSGCWGKAAPPSCDLHPAGQPDCDGPEGKFVPPEPCGAVVVPIALITLTDEKKWEAGFEIDRKGRHYVPGPLHPTTLTRICETNWKHNDKRAVDKLEPENQFTVTFNNPLDDSMGALGQELTEGRQVFQVYYTYSEDGWQPHWLTPKQVTVGKDRRSVAFELDLDKCSQTNLMLKYARLYPNTPPVVFITLRCDFLLDDCGRAVDGNHLRHPGWKGNKHGSLPTGDGVPGGTFESWFTLLPNTPEQKKQGE